MTHEELVPAGVHCARSDASIVAGFTVALTWRDAKPGRSFTYSMRSLVVVVVEVVAVVVVVVVVVVTVAAGARTTRRRQATSRSRRGSRSSATARSRTACART